MPGEDFYYQPMADGEEDLVCSLIARVFDAQVTPSYTSNGKSTFLRMLSPHRLAEMANGEYSFVVVAKYRGRPVGVVAVIARSHIALLFVESGMQGRGIGRHLLEIAADTVCHKYPEVSALTVSSSQNSISFYVHAGFTEDGEEVDEEGMRFMPMKKPIG